MQFSVIIPTRNRPRLFSVALASVISQTTANFEIICVNDGSDAKYDDHYRVVLNDAKAKLGERFQFHHLVRRPHGHGPGYALNYGVAHASGTYLGFLDDDDEWTSADHLARAKLALDRYVATDLYFSNQHAFANGNALDQPLWLAPLAPQLSRAGRKADADGNYAVSRRDLLITPGFCHLNTMVIRRDLYNLIGGMDETIRWEGDRDLYLRLIDIADIILFNPNFIARHNIPDPSQKNNMTTTITTLQKLLSQLRVVEKAALLAKSIDVRAHARLHLAYIYGKIANALTEQGRTREAADYRRLARSGRFRRALATKFGVPMAKLD